VVTSILSQVTGQLEKRFVLNALFPTLVFSLALIAAVAAVAGGIDTAIESWNATDTIVKTLLVIGWVALVFVTANMVANGALWIIRLFEGYVAPASWFGALGRQHQLEIASELLEHNPDEFHQRFPPHPRRLEAKDVAPTTLGNLLLSAEVYSIDRYGVDSVRMWPRLYHLIPETLSTSMAEARASMEFLLVVAFFAALYAPIASLTIMIGAGPVPWFVASLGGGTLIAFVAYFAALAPAAIYADHIRAAYDLHRLELLAALGLPRPATLAEERRLWGIAVHLLDRGEEHVSRYVPKPA
jgi:hypothetical protein